MAEDSGIRWTHDTVNGWWGCDKDSPACAHCYAEEWSDRHSPRLAGEETLWGKNAPRWLRMEAALRDLERAARRSDKEGHPRRVFMHSMSDIFEDRDDLVEPRKRLWDRLHVLAGNAEKRRITPLVLTKREDVMLAWAKEHGWPGGAAAGVTVESQRYVQRRVPVLLQVPGALAYFVSAEPLLGEIDLELVAHVVNGDPGYLNALSGEWVATVGDDRLPRHQGNALGWVIVGGESGGHRSRPMLPSWARKVRTACVAQDVPFFFKQHGTWASEDQLAKPQGLPVATQSAQDCGQVLLLHRWAGDKTATGHLLDGATWEQLPAGWAP